MDTGVSPQPDIQDNILDGIDVSEGGTQNSSIDSDGHGTGMAGIIAAHGRSRKVGALGIAPDASILPARVSNSTNLGTSLSVAAGIRWTALRGAAVINVSASTGPSLALNDALNTAAAADSVVIASAGNKPDYLQFGYPAAAPGVLAVGATDRKNKHAAFSLRDERIQLCAPGVDIVSPRLNGGYVVADGTSSSAAIVSGAAALVRAHFPELTAHEVIHRLTSTADDIDPPGRDDECGFGVLNIIAALTADVPPIDAGSASSTVPETPSVGASDGAGGESEGADVGLLVAGGGLLTVVLGAVTAFYVVRRRRGGHGV